MTDQPYRMEFDIGTIKHLGLQMYSTLPPVIAELVANSWDAGAGKVEIDIPTLALDEDSSIVVTDDGDGMTDDQVRAGYLVVGRDRRAQPHADEKLRSDRPVMGRKGIGKFAGFGIATQIEVETVRDAETSHFVMDFNELQRVANKREIEFEPIAPSGAIQKGTRISLRRITRFRTRRINIDAVRRGLARRFAVIGEQWGFQVVVNGTPISVEERDLKRLLDVDATGRPYLWVYSDREVAVSTGWTVSGWVGALKRTDPIEDGIQRGITIMARGKLVQEPFVFEAVVGQQYALSYLVGEFAAEFVDAAEDTVGTTRNSLVWDTEANQALKVWGQTEINRIAREWAERRSRDNETVLEANDVYQRFRAEAGDLAAQRSGRVADRLIRNIIKRNPLAVEAELEQVVQLCLDFLKFDTFVDLAEKIAESADPMQVLDLFREWEVVEAHEMSRVTVGRIRTIEKLQRLIDEDALEVPTLHNFLKEFPWVIDPRWTLIADERRYSDMLREQFPDADEPEEDRRIDFLCVREGTHLVVVEIKRPGKKVSRKELTQIEEYVAWMREYVSRTTDPDMRIDSVEGYLLCGGSVDTPIVRQRIENLRRSQIYVRRYGDLLDMVRRSHAEFLTRYERIKSLRAGENAARLAAGSDVAPPPEGAGG